MEAVFFYPWLVPIFCLFFGLIIGSFLNVVIFRLPKMMMQSWQNECSECFPHFQIPKYDKKLSLSLPLSHCPKCKNRIKPWHNIPVLSWILLRGRCASCHKKISLQYPLVEITTAAISCFIAIHFGPSYDTACVLFFSYILIVSALIDVKTHLLPDTLTLPLLWCGLFVSLMGFGSTSLYDAVIGSMAGYLSLWTVYWLFKCITKKDGMGFGDFKLLAALGAWVGWQILPILVLISSLFGIIFGIIYFKQKEGQKLSDTPFAFGPCLAASGWICLIWKADILHLYLSYMLG